MFGTKSHGERQSGLRTPPVFPINSQFEERYANRTLCSEGLCEFRVVCGSIRRIHASVEESVKSLRAEYSVHIHTIRKHAPPALLKVGACSKRVASPNLYQILRQLILRIVP